MLLVSLPDEDFEQPLFWHMPNQEIFDNEHKASYKIQITQNAKSDDRFRIHDLHAFLQHVVQSGTYSDAYGTLYDIMLRSTGGDSRIHSTVFTESRCKELLTTIGLQTNFAHQWHSPTS